MGNWKSVVLFALLLASAVFVGAVITLSKMSSSRSWVGNTLNEKLKYQMHEEDIINAKAVAASINVYNAMQSDRSGWITAVTTAKGLKARMGDLWPEMACPSGVTTSLEERAVELIQFDEEGTAVARIVIWLP